MTELLDERVVEMRFDNKDFETNVNQSIKTIDKLKKSLNFKDAGESLDSLSSAAEKVDLSSVENSVEQIAVKFNLLEAVAAGVLTNIVNKAVDAGSRLVKSMTIDQVTAGWSKYESKTQSVQTIMAATHQSIETVNAELERLIWFADETSYSFTDMVNNVGKFTSAGVDLNRAVDSMMGISNWAALSGAGIQQASRAMYNLSQAMGIGYVGLMDWKSIELANMATIDFKESVIETAVALGQLRQEADGTIKTAKGTIITAETMRSSLNEKWFTSDVLTSVLDEYSSFANDVYDAQNDYIKKYGHYISVKKMIEQMEINGYDTTTKAAQAFIKAQEALSFTQVINATADAVSSGWMRTFELIFGNYEKAKKLWTDLANDMWDIFAESGETRNEMLTSIMDSKFQQMLDEMPDGEEFAARLEDKLYTIGKNNGKTEKYLQELFGSFDSIEAMLQRPGIVSEQSLQKAFNQLYEDYRKDAHAAEILAVKLDKDNQLLKNVIVGYSYGYYGKDLEQARKRLEELGWTNIDMIEAYAEQYAQGIQLQWDDVNKEFRENLDYQKTAYTEFAEYLNGIDPLGGFFSSIKELGGRDKLQAGFLSVLDNVKNIYRTVISIFDSISGMFGGGSFLSTLIDGFYKFTTFFTYDDDLFEAVKEEINEFFTQTIPYGIKKFIHGADRELSDSELDYYIREGITLPIDMMIHENGLIDNVKDIFHNYMAQMPVEISTAIEKGKAKVNEFFTNVKTKIDELKDKYLPKIGQGLNENGKYTYLYGGIIDIVSEKIRNLGNGFGGKVIDGITNFLKKIGDWLFGYEKDGEVIEGHIGAIFDKVTAFINMLKTIGKHVKDVISDIKTFFFGGKYTFSDAVIYNIFDRLGLKFEKLKQSKAYQDIHRFFFGEKAEDGTIIKNNIFGKIGTAIDAITSSQAYKSLYTFLFGGKESQLSINPNTGEYEEVINKIPNIFEKARNFIFGDSENGIPNLLERISDLFYSISLTTPFRLVKGVIDFLTGKSNLSSTIKYFDNIIGDDRVHPESKADEAAQRMSESLLKEYNERTLRYASLYNNGGLFSALFGSDVEKELTDEQGNIVGTVTEHIDGIINDISAFITGIPDKLTEVVTNTKSKIQELIRSIFGFDLHGLMPFATNDLQYTWSSDAYLTEELYTVSEGFYEVNEAYKDAYNSALDVISEYTALGKTAEDAVRDGILSKNIAELEIPRLMPSEGPNIEDTWTFVNLDNHVNGWIDNLFGGFIGNLRSKIPPFKESVLEIIAKPFEAMFPFLENSFLNNKKSDNVFIRMHDYYDKHYQELAAQGIKSYTEFSEALKKAYDGDSNYYDLYTQVSHSVLDKELLSFDYFLTRMKDYLKFYQDLLKYFFTGDIDSLLDADFLFKKITGQLNQYGDEVINASFFDSFKEKIIAFREYITELFTKIKTGVVNTVTTVFEKLNEFRKWLGLDWNYVELENGETILKRQAGVIDVIWEKIKKVSSAVYDFSVKVIAIGNSFRKWLGLDWEKINFTDDNGIEKSKWVRIPGFIDKVKNAIDALIQSPAFQAVKTFLFGGEKTVLDINPKTGEYEEKLEKIPSIFQRIKSSIEDLYNSPFVQGIIDFLFGKKTTIGAQWNDQLRQMVPQYKRVNGFFENIKKSVNLFISGKAFNSIKGTVTDFILGPADKEGKRTENIFKRLGGHVEKAKNALLDFILGEEKVLPYTSNLQPVVIREGGLLDQVKNKIAGLRETYPWFNEFCLVIEKAFNKIKDIIKNPQKFFDETKDSVKAGIEKLKALFSNSKETFSTFVESIKRFFVGYDKEGTQNLLDLDPASNHVDGLIDKIKKKIAELRETYPWFNSFCEFIETQFQNLKNILTEGGNSISNIVENIKKYLFGYDVETKGGFLGLGKKTEHINGLIDNIKEIFEKIFHFGKEEKKETIFDRFGKVFSQITKSIGGLLGFERKGPSLISILRGALSAITGLNLVYAGFTVKSFMTMNFNKEPLTDFVDAIKQVAVSIAILAGTLIGLTIYWRTLDFWGRGEFVTMLALIAGMAFGLYKFFEKMDKLEINWKAALVIRALADAILTIGILIGALTLITKFTKSFWTFAGVTFLISVLALAIGGAARLMMKTAKEGEKIKTAAGSLFAIAAILFALTGLIATLVGAFLILSLITKGKTVKDFATPLQILGGIFIAAAAMIVGLLVGVGVLSNKAKDIPNKVIVVLGVLSIFTLFITMLAGIASVGNNWQALISIFAGLAAVVLAMAGAIKILSTVKDINDKSIVYIFILTAILAALTFLIVILAKFSKDSKIFKNFNDIAPILAALTGAIVALFGVTVIFSIISLIATETHQVPFGAVMKVFGELALFIIGLISVALLLGGALNLVDSKFGDGASLSAIEKFGAILKALFQALGEAIGQLIGGLVGGAVVGFTDTLPAIADGLTEFIVHLKPFIDEISKLDASCLVGIGIFTVLMLALAIDEFLLAIGSIADIFVLGDPSTMATNLSTFMTNLQGFLSRILLLNDSHLVGAGILTTLLLSLAIDEILLAISSIASIFVLGDPATMATNLSTFITNLQGFLLRILLLNERHLTGVGIFTGIMLAIGANELLSIIPSLISSLLGESLAEMGTNLSTFMTNLQGFLSGILLLNDNHLLGASIFTGIMLSIGSSTFLAIFPGLVQWVLGENFTKIGSNMSLLYVNLLPFLSGIKTLSESHITGAGYFAQVMQKVGSSTLSTAFSTLVQGVVNDENFTKVGTNMSDLYTNLSGFLTGVVNLSEAHVAGAGYFNQVMQKVGSSTLSTAFSTLVQGVVNDENFTKVGTNMSDLYTNLSGFLSGTVNLSEAHVTGAGYFGQVMQKVGSSTLSTAFSTLVQGVVKDENFTKVGSNMSLLYVKLLPFLSGVSNLSESHVTGAGYFTQIMTSITGESILAVFSSAISGIVGDENFTQVGTNMSTLMTSLSGYLTEIRGLDESDVKKAGYLPRILGTIVSSNLYTGAEKLTSWLTGSDTTNYVDLFDKLTRENGIVDGVMSFAAKIHGKDFSGISEASEAITSIFMLLSILSNVANVKESTGFWDNLAGIFGSETVSLEVVSTALDSITNKIVPKVLDFQNALKSNNIDAEYIKNTLGIYVDLLKTIFALNEIEPEQIDLTKYSQIGTYVVEGLALSLESTESTSRIHTAAVSLGQALIDGLMEGTDSASPSKAAYAVGQFVAQGLYNGIAAGQPMNYKLAQMFGEHTIESLEKGLSQHTFNMVTMDLVDENIFNMPDFMDEIGNIDFDKMSAFLHEKFDEALGSDYINGFVGQMRKDWKQIPETLDETRTAIIQRISAGEFGSGQDAILAALEEELGSIDAATAAWNDYNNVLSENVRMNETLIKQRKENPPMTYEEYMEMVEHAQEGLDLLNSGEIDRLAAQNGTTREQELSRLGYDAALTQRMANDYYSQFFTYLTKEQWEEMFAARDYAEQTNSETEKTAKVTETATEALESEAEALDSVNKTAGKAARAIDNVHRQNVIAGKDKKPSDATVDEEPEEDISKLGKGTDALTVADDEKRAITAIGEAGSAAIDETVDRYAAANAVAGEFMLTAEEAAEAVEQTAEASSDLSKSLNYKDINKSITALREGTTVLTDDQIASLEQLRLLYSQGFFHERDEKGNVIYDEKSRQHVIDELTKRGRSLSTENAAWVADHIYGYNIRERNSEIEKTIKLQKDAAEATDASSAAVDKETKSFESLTENGWGNFMDAFMLGENGEISLDLNKLFSGLSIDNAKDLKDNLIGTINEEVLSKIDLSGETVTIPEGLTFSLGKMGKNGSLGFNISKEQFNEFIGNLITQLQTGDLLGTVTEKASAAGISDILSFIKNPKAEGRKLLIGSIFDMISGKVEEINDTTIEPEVATGQLEYACNLIEKYKKDVDDAIAKPAIGAIQNGDKVTAAQQKQLENMYYNAVLGFYGQNEKITETLQSKYGITWEELQSLFLPGGHFDTSRFANPYLDYANKINAQIQEGSKDYTTLNLFQDIADGLWGTDAERKEALKAAKYDVDKILPMFNKWLTGSLSAEEFSKLGDHYGRLTDAEIEAKEETERLNQVLNSTPEGAFKAVGDFLSGVEAAIKNTGNAEKFNEFINDVVGNLKSIELPNASAFESVGNFLKMVKSVSAGSTGISTDFGTLMNQLETSLNSVEFKTDQFGPLNEFFANLVDVSNSISDTLGPFTNFLDDVINISESDISGNAEAAAESLVTTLLDTFVKHYVDFNQIGKSFVMQIVQGMYSRRVNLISVTQMLAGTILAGFKEHAVDKAALQGKDFIDEFTTAIGSKESKQQFEDSIASLFAQGETEAAEGAADTATPGKAFAQQFMQDFSEGITTDTVGVTTAFSTMVSNMTTSLASLDGISASVQTAMMELPNGIMAGLGAASEPLLKAVGMINSILTSAVPDGYSLGMNFAIGLAQGMQDGMAMVFGVGFALGNSALDGAEDSTKTASPSREFMKLGRFMDEGLAIGINKNSGIAYDAGENLGNALLSGSRDALGIHSPSDEGENDGENYAGTLADTVVDNSYQAYNAGEIYGKTLLDGTADTFAANFESFNIADPFINAAKDFYDAGEILGKTLIEGTEDTLLASFESFNVEPLLDNVRKYGGFADPTSMVNSIRNNLGGTVDNSPERQLIAAGQALDKLGHVTESQAKLIVDAWNEMMDGLHGNIGPNGTGERDIYLRDQLGGLTWEKLSKYSDQKGHLSIDALVGGLASIDEVVKAFSDTYAGLLGNGAERIDKLAERGINPEIFQKVLAEFWDSNNKEVQSFEDAAKQYNKYISEAAGEAGATAEKVDADVVAAFRELYNGASWADPSTRQSHIESKGMNFEAFQAALSEFWDGSNKDVTSFEDAARRYSEIVEQIKKEADEAGQATADALSANPIISPVFELDGKQYADTSRYIEAVKAAQQAARNFWDQKNSATPSEAPAGQTVINNTYNQTNNSPKPLNRAEIYRQTRNQFSQISGFGVRGFSSTEIYAE